STIVAMIFETFAVLLFFGLNLHHFMILFVHHSFASLQSLSFTELPTEDLVALTGKLPEFGLLIMAPVGVMAFVVLVALFLLSKAAPTLNLFSVGMPLRVGLGVLSLFIFLPVLWTSIEAYFYRMIGELEQFMGYFANG
ncbi:MAG TPA: flagellar biosynthetic protein FliR, partial [Pirellulaceae bacterium]|nr:flagellar biosynthetic protein FliR [Pirellulaceae bacterium]